MATYNLLASTVLSTGQGTITFSSIPATYTDLVLRFSARSATADVQDTVYVRFNSNTSLVYSRTRVQGNGATITSANNSSTDTVQFTGGTTGATATANTFGSSEVYVPSYLAPQFKQIGVVNTQETNATTAYMGFTAGLWQNTTPVTSINLTLASNDGVTQFVAGSSFYLYGVFNGPETLPSTPTIGTATSTLPASASVTFTPTSATGVDASYTVLSSPGSITATGTSSPITVSGLTNDTAYTFQVRANNPGGSSVYSAASNSVTPEAQGFESLQTTTLAVNAAIINFTSIPAGYKYLQVRGMMKTDAAGNGDQIAIRVNADVNSTNYTSSNIRAEQAAFSAGFNTGVAEVRVTNVHTNATGGQFFSPLTIDVLATNNQRFKMFSSTTTNFSGAATASTGLSVNSGQWFSTSAVSQLRFAPVSGANFITSSTIAIYGIKE